MPTPPRMIGTSISHYRITAKLGEGGMGAVYEAEDIKLQRQVALKFLPPDLAADRFARERLVREAQAASRLSHPNIATIYEINDEVEPPFIAMELVRGESLKEVLRHGPVPCADLVEIAIQIAEGLNEAHRLAIVHRDIKPGNIMLDGRRRVKILDFGLAVVRGLERGQDEAVESFLTRTATQWTTGGTVPYMSPEQLRGERPDPRSDIFSFGVLLYESLTGRIPFWGETGIDIMHAILHQFPVPLRSVIPDLPLKWEELVQRCLEKSSERRFGSMQEVLKALQVIQTQPLDAEKSLAVLYFENLGAAKEDEYFRDGITEDIIIELSKIKHLRVYPRSAVFSYRDKPITAPEIGRQLNARYVLSGSLRRAGNRLRITAQLVETGSGHSIWAERYDRDMEDVFAIQDEIAHSIANALQVMLTEKEKRAIEKRPTTDIQAYDYYLRGRHFFYQMRYKTLDFARQMFARAIALDPDFARAYAGLADCCSFLYMYWKEPSEANLREAEAASRKAVELDPELAEAHAARGLAVSLNKRLVEAQNEFETAIRLNPRLFEAYYFYGRARFAQGRLEDAAKLFQLASQVNPDDYQAPNLLGMVYTALGRREEAKEVYRLSLQNADKHLKMYPEDARAYYLGAGALWQLGESERSADWAARALAIDPEDPSVLYNIACVYSLQDKWEEAIDCLEEAVEHGFAHKEWIQHDSDLNALRSNPRFQALLSRL